MPCMEPLCCNVTIYNFSPHWPQTDEYTTICPGSPSCRGPDEGWWGGGMLKGEISSLPQVPPFGTVTFM